MREAPTIVLIGAGSTSFGLSTLHDLYADPVFTGATIWLVDLVGSTRLATSVGPARADELRAEFFALLRDAIEGSGGKEFKNTGDGLFVAFSSASGPFTMNVTSLRPSRSEGSEDRTSSRHPCCSA